MISFAEIARTYFPHLQAKCASRSLTRWIQRCPDLWEELTRLGRSKGQRHLTPQMVNRIYYFLGTP
ncbi:MAG: DUF4248 domain-containing protein [Bacteroidales bacterium]